jgi:hypothetical protein
MSSTLNPQSHLEWSFQFVFLFIVLGTHTTYHTYLCVLWSEVFSVLLLTAGSVRWFHGYMQPSCWKTDTLGGCVCRINFRTSGCIGDAGTSTTTVLRVLHDNCFIGVIDISVSSHICSQSTRMVTLRVREGHIYGRGMLPPSRRIPHDLFTIVHLKITYHSDQHPPRVHTPHSRIHTGSCFFFITEFFPEADSVKPITYSVSESTITFTLTPTPCSHSKISHEQRFMFFFLNPKLCSRDRFYETHCL